MHCERANEHILKQAFCITVREVIIENQFPSGQSDVRMQQCCGAIK